MQQAQRSVTAHAAVSDLSDSGRHLVQVQRWRNLRIGHSNNGAGRFLDC
jgi:hypothetical protein